MVVTRRASHSTAAVVFSFLLCFNAEKSAAAAGDVWTSTGLQGTRVSALVVDPLFPDTLYAGTEEAGIFKSTDGGASWVTASNGLPGPRVFALIIDPQLPTTLYASVSGGGIFKSTDGAETWVPASTGIPPSIRMTILSLAIDPATSSTLYAGSNDAGVFKSTDAGNTWTFASGVSPVTITSLAVDPQLPSTVYAGTDLNLWKSTDGGATWTKTPLERVTVFALAIDPQSSATVYAGIRSFSTEPGSSGVARSTDGGATWMTVNNGLPGHIGMALAIHPRTPQTVYVGTSGAGVFRTTDGAEHWTEMNEGLTNLTVMSLAIDPQGTVLYAGTAGGGVFVRPIAAKMFPLTVGKAGPGSGSVTSDPAGIDCGETCSASYEDGTTVKLTATSSFGSIFIGWQGCDAVHGQLCWVTVNGPRSVSAEFVGIRLPALSLHRFQR